VLPEGRDEISQFFAKFPPRKFSKAKKKKKKKKNSSKYHPNLHFKGF
jgi:hypothetical protein